MTAVISLYILLHRLVDLSKCHKIVQEFLFNSHALHLK